MSLPADKVRKHFSVDFYQTAAGKDTFIEKLLGTDFNILKLRQQKSQVYFSISKVRKFFTCIWV